MLSNQRDYYSFANDFASSLVVKLTMSILSSLQQFFQCDHSHLNHSERPTRWRSKPTQSHPNESNSGHRLSKQLRHASIGSIISQSTSSSFLRGSQERSYSRRELDFNTSVGDDVHNVTFYDTATLLQNTEEICRLVFENALMPMMKTAGPDHRPHTDALATIMFYMSDVIELLTGSRAYCAKSSMAHPHKSNGSRHIRNKKCAFCALINILNTITAVDGAYIAAIYSNRYMNNSHGISTWEATKVEAFWKLMMPASMLRSYGVESKDNCSLHMQNLLGCLSIIEAHGEPKAY